MSTKHQKTYDAIFSDPVRSNIIWEDVEALLIFLGAEMKEGNGSRVRFTANNIHAVFHRPHPQKEIVKPAVKDVRRFIKEAGLFL